MKLSVVSLTGGYGNQKVLNGINFSAEEGEMVYVLGANGCGKTTLFNIIVGFKARTSGDVLSDGRDIDTLSRSDMAKQIAYIPQDHFPAFNYNVLDIVLMGRASHLPPFGKPGNEDIEIAKQTLRTLGIVELAGKGYMNISGGQRQLVLIARAMCQQAGVIVMDEPLQSLDFVNQAMVTQALGRLVAHQYTILMSTHTAVHSFDSNAKVLLMDKSGSAVFGGLEQILTKENIEAAYGLPVQTIIGEDERGGKHLLCLPMQS